MGCYLCPTHRDVLTRAAAVTVVSGAETALTTHEVGGDWIPEW